MKKILATLLAVVMVVVCFAACGNEQSSEDVTVVRVWTGDAGGKSVWESLVKEFNETTGKEKGIKIEWSTYGGDFLTTLDLARQNDQLPEIAAVSDVKGYLTTGDIIPLTDMPGGQEFLDEYDVELIQGRNIIGDVICNVPATSNVPGLVYNKDMFKAAGLVDENGEALPPKTWDEVREYAKILTNTSKQQYGIAFPLKDASVYANYMLRTAFASSFGEMAVYDYENQTVSFDNYKYPLEWVMKIKEDKTFFPGAEGLDNDTLRAYFAQGSIGMYIGMSWDVGVLTTQFVADCDWGVAEAPLVEGMERQPTWRDMSGSYSITKNAKNVDLEKVMEVYKFIFSLNSRQKIYENGIRISCKSDVLEGANVGNLPPQFVDFAEMLDENFIVTVPPSLKLEGDKMDSMFLKVWAGVTTVDEAIDTLNKTYTAGLKGGIADGSIDPSFYLK